MNRVWWAKTGACGGGISGCRYRPSMRGWHWRARRFWSKNCLAGSCFLTTRGRIWPTGNYPAGPCQSGKGRRWSIGGRGGLGWITRGRTTRWVGRGGGVQGRLRLRSGLRPSLRLRRPCTPLFYHSQGDSSISVTKVTFLFLYNRHPPAMPYTAPA